jgi:hypothetical protein
MWDVKGIFLMEKCSLILSGAQHWRKIDFAYQYHDLYLGPFVFAADDAFA